MVASLYGPDRAHNRGRSRTAIAAFTKELQVDECWTDAGRHGHRSETGRHLRAIQADRVAFIGIHEHTQGDSGTKPRHKAKRDANQRHGEIGVSDGLDHFGRLNLCEHHIYGDHQQRNRNERAKTEPGKRDFFHGIRDILRSERRNTRT